MSEWQALGGNWTLFDGGVRNNSNERGAKLITGNLSWTDYSLDADVELLGQSGDAGVIVRSSDEELGVDSYSGYYAGLRTSNNMVVLGRADHGWMEFQVATLPGGIHAFHIYHLHVIAVGCQIAAIASDSHSQNKVTVALREEHCALSGRIGLRSYSSGGLWHHVHVARATEGDLSNTVQNVRVADSPEVLQTEAGFNSTLGISSRSTLDPWNVLHMDEMQSARSPSLRSLRVASGMTSRLVDVHGTVVLTSPEVFLQDSTGGVAVRGEPTTPLKIGDAIEVVGKVIPHPFSASFDRPQIHFLWSGEPAPALAVTASQAATGQFDAMFIEVEGRIRSSVEKAGNSSVIGLEGAHQRFSAILSGAQRDSSLSRLRPASLVRIRGVCVTDTSYTHDLIPFAVLLRTSNDIMLLAGPPWWSVDRLFQMAWVVTGLTFLTILLYFWAERWRLRAVLEERSRLAREIHDTLAQSFAGIALQLESSLIGSDGQTADVSNVETALQMARQSRREAHATVAALRNLSTQRPLSEVLETTIAQQTRTKYLELSVITADSIPRLGIEVETQILRIAQEAVANSLQHSHASRLEVHVTMEGKDLLLSVIDNGVGFDPKNVPETEGTHFGILGMTERAKAIKADLEISSSAEGTTVRLVVPEIESRLGIESRLSGAHYFRALRELLKNTLARILQRKSQS
jgi:signal transduction histidine kinase